MHRAPSNFVSLFRRPTGLYVVAVLHAEIRIEGGYATSAAVFRVADGPYTVAQFKHDARKLLMSGRMSSITSGGDVYPVWTLALDGLVRITDADWERLDDEHGLPELVCSHTSERGVELVSYDDETDGAL
jgi:hypothetical protein